RINATATATIDTNRTARIPDIRTSLSEYQCLNRVWQALDLSSLTIEPQKIRDLLLGLVHHHNCYFSIRIDKRSRQQRASARRTRDALRARLHKLRKVSDVVVRVCVD